MARSRPGSRVKDFVTVWRVVVERVLTQRGRVVPGCAASRVLANAEQAGVGVIVPLAAGPVIAWVHYSIGRCGVSSARCRRTHSAIAR